MIEGLKYRLTTEEFRGVLLKRMEFHAAKGRWYKEKIGILKEGGFDSELAQNKMSSLRSDPVEEFEKKIQKHADKVNEFAFMAQFLVLGEDYLLTSEDLREIGIVSARRY